MVNSFMLKEPKIYKLDQPHPSLNYYLSSALAHSRSDSIFINTAFLHILLVQRECINEAIAPLTSSYYIIIVIITITIIIMHLTVAAPL